MVNKKLGEGTYGIVELGQLEDGRQVAIKRLKADWDGKLVAMFDAERKMLCSLQHR
jgi:serine/threonine protein kinase